MATKRRKAAAAAAVAAKAVAGELRLKSPARGTRTTRRRSRRGKSAASATPEETGGLPGQEDGGTPASPRGPPGEPCSYKTPKRTRASRSRLPTFSSPANEADIQQEIFWDPQSPIAHNGQKKQAANGSTVEISEIVNRIAPQDEKPACYEGNLLGFWIGDDAIPCTPAITKVRSRIKANGPRVRQLKHREEELMKLAKQFDKNLTDAIQDQDPPCHNIIHTTSEAEESVEYEDETGVKNQQQQFLETCPKADAALPFGAVDGSTKALEPCDDSGQEPLDLEAEMALNELFDCPTQKCSGQLSQGLSDCSSQSSFHDNQRAPLEEALALDNISAASKCVIGEAPLREGSAAPVIECVAPVPTPKAKETSEQTAPKESPCKTGSILSSKADRGVNDGFDDWGDDSFLLQITQNLEQINTPEDVLPHGPSENCERKEKTVVSDQGALVNSFKSDPTSSALQKQSIGTGNTKTVLPHNNFIINTEEARSIPTSGHNISCYNPIPVKLVENKSKQGGFTQIKCPASSSFPEKRSFSFSEDTDVPKPQLGKYRSSMPNIDHQSPFVFSSIKPLDIRKTAGSDSAGHLKQRELPKSSVFSFDDWNEPKFSDEVLDLFCESDSLWDTNADDDDDLLYQVCDNVEKNTLSQEVVKENEKAKSVVGSTSKVKVGPCLTAANQGISNCLQARKSHTGRKTFSLDAPVRTTTLLKSENSTGPVQQNWQPFKTENVNCIPGKWYRSHSVPGGDFGSGSGSSDQGLSDSCLKDSNMQWQNGLCNIGKVQNNSRVNQLPTEKSKYVFRKTNHFQALALDHKSLNVGSPSETVLGLGENKNAPNIPFQTATQTNTKPPFKRHLSSGFAQYETEQKNAKCSQEEIARKKQEALERRKCKMQALLKNTAPT